MSDLADFDALDPDMLLYKSPGSVTFFYVPKSGKIHYDTHQRTHEDMLHDEEVFDDVYAGMLKNPTSSSRLYGPYASRKEARKVAILGRIGVFGSMPVITLWTDTKNPHFGRAIDALLRQFPKLKSKKIFDNLVVKGVGEPAQMLVDVVGKGPAKSERRVWGKAEEDKEMERLKMLPAYHKATGAEKEALKQLYGFGHGGEATYPDAAGWSDEEKADYPWKRSHWRQAARKIGAPGVFDYGEFRSFVSFQNLFLS